NEIRHQNIKRYCDNQNEYEIANGYLLVVVPQAPNAGVQRRRTAPNEGRPLAFPSPAQNILTDFTFPPSDDSKLVASGMTERGAGAVRCNDLFGSAMLSRSSLPNVLCGNMESQYILPFLLIL